MRPSRTLVVVGVGLSALVATFLAVLLPASPGAAVDTRGVASLVEALPTYDGGRLLWQNPVGGVIDHTAVRYAAGAVPATVTSGSGVVVAGRGMTATLSGLTHGVEYFVRPFTVYTDGHTVAGDPLDLTPAMAPPDNVVVDASNGTTSYAFDAPDGAEAADVLLTETDGAVVEDRYWPGLVDGTHVSGTFGGLTNGSTYEVHIEITGRDGSASEPVGFYPLDATPRVSNADPTSPDVTQYDSGPSQLIVPDDATGQDLGSDADGDRLRIVAFSQPQHGYAFCSEDNCGYWPESTVQEDSFTYTVGDGHGGRSGPVTATIHKRTFAAVNDTITLPRNVNRSIRVAANDGGFDADAGDSVDVPIQSGISSLMISTPCCPGDDQGALGVLATSLGGFRVQYLAEDHDGDEIYRANLIVHVQGLAVSTWGPVSRWVGRPLALTVHTYYATAGDRLVIQRWTGSSWRTVSPAKTLTSATTYSLVSSGRQPTGSWKYRVAELTPAGAPRSGMTTGTATRRFYQAGLPWSTTTGNEYVAIKNTGKVTFNLSRWTITTKAGHVFTLPSKSLAPGKTVRIHPGFGTTTSSDIYLKKTRTAFWPHDTLRLKDYPLKLVVATRSF